MDPLGIQGGSSPKTGDPGILDHIKIGGSSETTYPFYNIKKVELQKKLRCARPDYEDELI